MPIPDRFYSDISMDFITKSPPSETPFGKEKATNILVITDRLIKNVTLEALPSTAAEAVANRFMWSYYRFHGFPKSVTSDQGPQWIGRFWKHLCKLTGIEQRLTSTYHPQTDGGTERWNQEVWAYLRAYVGFAQKDWAKLLFVAQVALNNRPNTIGLSPFFITHGYHASPIEVIATNFLAKSEEKRAELFLSHIQEAQEFCQTAIAAAQQQQESYANKNRSASEKYKVGDKVWLSFENYESSRPKKKMDWLRGKYIVSKVPGSHNVELTGLPKNINPVFHVDQIRRAAEDPLPGQKLHDSQPPPIRTPDGDDEQFVEEILCARTANRGRGLRRLVLVSWKGFADPTWEPLENFEETEALDRFEKIYGDIKKNDGPLDDYWHAKKKIRKGGGF